MIDVFNKPYVKVLRLTCYWLRQEEIIIYVIRCLYKTFHCCRFDQKLNDYYEKLISFDYGVTHVNLIIAYWNWNYFSRIFRGKTLQTTCTLTFLYGCTRKANNSVVSTVSYHLLRVPCDGVSRSLMDTMSDLWAREGMKPYREIRVVLSDDLINDAGEGSTVLLQPVAHGSCCGRVHANHCSAILDWHHLGTEVVLTSSADL